VDALLARDVDTLAKAIWADDFSQITDRGELRNKRHRLMAFRDGRVQIKGLTNSIDEVRVYGSTALVTGYTKRTWEEETKEFSGTFRFTRVWVKKDAGWRLVHMQLTKTGE
jgi:hypothetical protein